MLLVSFFSLDVYTYTVCQRKKIISFDTLSNKNSMFSFQKLSMLCAKTRKKLHLEKKCKNPKKMQNQQQRYVSAKKVLFDASTLVSIVIEEDK